MLLLDGSLPREAAIRSLPRSAPRPAVYCVSCGRLGHYALTDRHAYFRHANGELRCAPRALESALHQRAKRVLLEGIAKTRASGAPLVWTRRCDRCGASACTTLLPARSWSGERAEASVEWSASGGRFAFDVGVFDGGDLVLALEVRHAHAVDGRKLDAAVDEGLPLLEIRAGDLVDGGGRARWTGAGPMPAAFVFRVASARCPHRCPRCIERGDDAAARLARVADAFVARVVAQGLAIATPCVRCAGRVVRDLWPCGARVLGREETPTGCERELEVPSHGVVRVVVVDEPARRPLHGFVVADAETLVAACRAHGEPVLPHVVVPGAANVDGRAVCARCRCVSEAARELERLLVWAESSPRAHAMRSAIANALGASDADGSLARGLVAALDREPERFDGDSTWRAIALRGVVDSLRVPPLAILADHVELPAIVAGWTTVGDLLDAPHRRLARELAAGIEVSVGFEDVQRVARALGSHDPGWARAAAVAWVLARYARDGHTAFDGEPAALERRARALLGSTDDEGSTLDAAIMRGVVVADDTGLALRVHAERERRLARLVARCVRTKPRSARVRPVSAALTREQRESLSLAARLNLSVVTGAAGTGKTHALRSLVEALHHEKWLALAPTGKAASRLREALRERVPEERIGTVHRFLADDRPRAATAFILDEASMLDVETATRLFDRIVEPRGRPPRIVLVGDENQLPPVGAGAVLRDLLAAVDSSGGPVVPRVRLGVVHRSTTSLTTFAREFLQGRVDLDAIETFPCDGDETALRAAELALAHRLSTDPASVQILATTNASVGAIDREVRRRLPRLGATLGRFRDGEKVICRRNRYGRPRVMNGEVGVLRVVRPTNQLPWAEVDFGNGDVRAPFSALDLEDFATAYALTIHKSQGSEWPTVVVALDSSARTIDRALVYTAITRAKQHLIVVGALDAMLRSAARGSSRTTSLAERIRRSVEEPT